MADDRPVPAQTSRTALDRAAVERVLARAAELQVTGTEGPDGGALSEAQLLDIAKEAGLSPDHVRRAIAEERTRVTLPAERGMAASVAGPSMVGAARIVQGAPGAISSALGRWLERDASMRVLRRFGERVVWEPRNDFLGNVRRGFGGDAQVLRSIRGLAVTVSDAGEGRSFVRLDADISRGRSQRLALAGTAATGGTLAGAALFGVGVVAHAALAVLAPVAVLPVLVGAGAGWAVARSHRAAAERAQTLLEHLLDRLEHGDLGSTNGSPLLDVLQEVRRVLR